MTEFPSFKASRPALGPPSLPFNKHWRICHWVWPSWSVKLTILLHVVQIAHTEAIYSGILRKKCRRWNHCLFLMTFNPCVRPWHRSKENINMKFKEVGWECMNRINLGQDTLINCYKPSCCIKCGKVADEGLICIEPVVSVCDCWHSCPISPTLKKTDLPPDAHYKI